MSTQQTTFDACPTSDPTTDAVIAAEINDADDVFAAVDEFVDEILTAADQAVASDRLVNYLDQAAAVGFGRYSSQNQVALISQLNNREEEYKDYAPHWAGFWTWQNEHNRVVEKGETGFTILAPVTGPACPHCGNAPNYHDGNDALDCPRAGENPDTWDFDPQEEWSEGTLYFSTATTFAFQQTKPLEDADDDDTFTPQDVANGDDDRAATLFDTLTEAAESGVLPSGELAVRTEGRQYRPQSKGASRGGEIFVASGERQHTDRFRTLVHEIAHEILHQNTNNVPDNVKEVEAEAIAYTVSKYFGFDASGSDLYIGSWIDHAHAAASDTADDDTDAVARGVIKNRIDTIQNTAATIITTIEEKEGEEREEE